MKKKWMNVKPSFSVSAYQGHPHGTLLKAELLQEGIFFLIHLFAWEISLLKMLEIEETKTT